MRVSGAHLDGWRLRTTARSELAIFARAKEESYQKKELPLKAKKLISPIGGFLCETDILRLYTHHFPTQIADLLPLKK